ncbi:hypothetical protein Ae201684P_004497 [Aphanomyces euteiches]|nr:hypothetical protein Ae201684P_004497 [Aphanomyces euteiches]KAH9153241.1 hypothetical protein AeRB84_004467 [Aphanomyces euteiches]
MIDNVVVAIALWIQDATTLFSYLEAFPSKQRGVLEHLWQLGGKYSVSNLWPTLEVKIVDPTDCIHVEAIAKLYAFIWIRDVPSWPSLLCCFDPHEVKSLTWFPPVTPGVLEINNPNVHRRITRIEFTTDFFPLATVVPSLPCLGKLHVLSPFENDMEIVFAHLASSSVVNFSTGGFHGYDFPLRFTNAMLQSITTWLGRTHCRRLCLYIHHHTCDSISIQAFQTALFAQSSLEIVICQVPHSFFDFSTAFTLPCNLRFLRLVVRHGNQLSNVATALTGSSLERLFLTVYPRHDTTSIDSITAVLSHTKLRVVDINGQRILDR